VLEGKEDCVRGEGGLSYRRRRTVLEGKEDFVRGEGGLC
jgi:hypothetical protein